jgi:hypothetical protein
VVCIALESMRSILSGRPWGWGVSTSSRGWGGPGPKRVPSRGGLVPTPTQLSSRPRILGRNGSHPRGLRRWAETGPIRTSSSESEKPPELVARRVSRGESFPGRGPKRVPCGGGLVPTPTQPSTRPRILGRPPPPAFRAGQKRVPSARRAREVKNPPSLWLGGFHGERVSLAGDLGGFADHHQPRWTGAVRTVARLRASRA